MEVTELLVTGYAGKDAVFAVNLVPGAAKVILTDETGGSVKSAWQQASDAYTTVHELLEDLVVAAPAAACS